MDLNLLLTILLVLNIALLLLEGAFILYIREERLLLKDEEKELRKDDAAVLNQTKEKSASILHHAIKQANAILVNSELKGIRLFSRYKLDTNKMETEYQKHLAEFEKKMIEEMKTSLTRGEESYNKMVVNVTEVLKNNTSESEKMLKEKADSLLLTAQKELSSFVTEIQSGVKSQVNRELVSARSMIEEYKQRRLSAVEENIVEILEKTLMMTLSKKISLEDQSEYVFKALEEAKKERLFS